MRKIFLLFMLTFTVSLFAGSNNDRTVITSGSLFEEMIDMTGLSSFPDPAYRTIQFSSYDHRSQIPGGADWFANADGFGGDPIPNFEKVLKAPDEYGIGEYLIADVTGPGATVRLWRNGGGRVRCHNCGADTHLVPSQKSSREIDTGCPEGGPSCLNCTLPECVMDKKRQYGHCAAVR